MTFESAAGLRPFRGAAVALQVPFVSVAISPHPTLEKSSYPPTAMHHPTAGQLSELRPAAFWLGPTVGAVAALQVPPDNVSINPQDRRDDGSPYPPTATQELAEGQQTLASRGP